VKAGDLVKVIVTNPTSRDPDTGVVVGIVDEYAHAKLARIALTNGHIATYWLSNLEVISESR
tara:strand:- start:32 stop:217 length:186 start_codon:yes stop_codon:yes gene_type:complete